MSGSKILYKKCYMREFRRTKTLRRVSHSNNTNLHHLLKVIYFLKDCILIPYFYFTHLLLSKNKRYVNLSCNYYITKVTFYYCESSPGAPSFERLFWGVLIRLEWIIK